MSAPVIDRPAVLDYDRCTITRRKSSTRIVPNYPVFNSDGSRVIAVIHGPNFVCG